MSNNYLKYTSRDYDSILTDLTESISSISDTWTSREDSDPGIVLVKLMSALGDMLSFNMDKQALEYYAPTVTQRKNAQKLFELIGYKMHWYRAATTTITLKNTIPIPSELQAYIDYVNAESTAKKRTIYTQFCNSPYLLGKTSGGYAADDWSDNPENVKKWENELSSSYDDWRTNKNNAINLNLYIDDPNSTLKVGAKGNSYYSYIIEPTTNKAYKDDNSNTIIPTKVLYPGEEVSYTAIQGNLCKVSFNVNRMRDNKFYLPDSNVDETYMYLQYVPQEGSVVTNTDIISESQNNFFTKVDNLLTQTDGGLHFQFGVDEFDFPYIELSSYWKEILKSSNITFNLFYIRTDGKYGNVTKNYLTYIGGISQKKLTITHSENNDYVLNADGEVICTPGKNPQTASDAYKDSLNYIMTYNTLVTIYDFERFTKRQPTISNAFAVDGQRANDLNSSLVTKCNNLTLIQLQDLLKTNGTKEELVSELIRRRTVHYDFREGYVPGKNNVSEYTKYKPYGLNIHVVSGYFDTESNDINSPGIVATYSKTFNGKTFPYYLYCINLESSENDKTSIKNKLDREMQNCRIVNVRPEYSAVRVFPFRCCGTIYLTQPVTQEVANSIMKAVMNNLKNAYHPSNLAFGERITYMSIIDVISNSSDYIRYFDAGLGSRKLIYFDGSDDVESYFNSISLMHFVQTYEENEKELNDDGTENKYYHLLSIDPEYILKD